MTSYNTLCKIFQIYTPTKYAQKQSFPLENIITNKEKYHNILNELLELQSMPHIGEQNVILADGEQWKSDFE